MILLCFLKFRQQRYCKSKTTQNKLRFIYIVEMQRTLFNGINKTLLSKTSAEKSLSFVI
ncbi:Uncharacterised protein [Segatella copri]|nr:Uncharacterised protein [Segatella copri]